jgi:hypothetical protein
MVQEWESREKEMDLYPWPITTSMWFLLRNVGLFKYYKEVSSLKGNSTFLHS